MRIPKPIQTPPPSKAIPSRSFLAGFNVVYGGHIDEKPSGVIRELSGQDPNINAGFGGKFVWIVPRFTDDVCEIAYFVVNITDKAENGLQNLAEGAGGKFRYLVDPKLPEEPARDMALLRTKERQDTAPEGWHFITSDINEGRGGDYLYIVTML